MVEFFRTMKIAVMAASAGAFLLALPTAADAQSTTGTVRFQVTKGGFIVGVGGGSGTLSFRGRTYRLGVSGLSAGTIGVSSAEFVGTAAPLRTPQDIAGTYSAAGAGLAVAGGGSSITLQNSNGVVMRLRGRQAGFQASLGVGGVTITLQQ
jgi:hypothetical protein